MIAEKVKSSSLAHTVYRLYKATVVSSRYAGSVFRHALASKETSTFSYRLTSENELYLVNLVADITGSGTDVVNSYFQELKLNEELKNTVIALSGKSAFRKKKDRRCDFGVKLAFYAIIRIQKPALVVENGVEVGFTSIVLSEALRRNVLEGYTGRFVGMDINKDAGYLVTQTSMYNGIAEMIYGDTIETLNNFTDKIDFYFSDGLRTYAYEKMEFAALKSKLSHAAMVITNKATFSKALFEFTKESGRQFSYFKEHPLGHWYEGSGIGIMHTPRR